MIQGLVRHRRDRDESPDETEFLASLEFLAAHVDVIDIEHADALQALGIGFAENGDPVVVDAADLGQEFAVRNAVPEEALARLQARPPDAVRFIVFDHSMRIISALANVSTDSEEIDL